MKVYLAGNFPIMGNEDKEAELYKKLGPRYHRLGSFFFKQTETLLKVRKRVKKKEKKKK